MLVCNASVDQPMLVLSLWANIDQYFSLGVRCSITLAYVCFSVRDPRATTSMSGDPPFWALQVQSMREACSFWISPSLPITPSSHQRYSMGKHLPFLFILFEVLKRGCLILLLESCLPTLVTHSSNQSLGNYRQVYQEEVWTQTLEALFQNPMSGHAFYCLYRLLPSKGEFWQTQQLISEWNMKYLWLS